MAWRPLARMKAAAAAAIVVASWLPPSNAQDSAQGCVHLPVIHSTNTHYLGKRAVELPLTNRTDVAYYAQLNIGTPPQSVHVQLDTGSFELWVNPQCATLHSGDAAFCQTAGQYSTETSSTARNLAQSKTLSYGIGSANIDYFADTVSLPGSNAQLADVQLGVATTTANEFAGILGIGYGDGIALPYPNLVDQLARQNVTRLKGYTLALGSQDEQEGVVVFGGIDTSKFAGLLARQPIIPAARSPDGVPRFWIHMAGGLSLTPPGRPTHTYANSSVPVFLDSGSTMTLLPEALATALAADLGAHAPDANGFYTVDCGLANLDGSVNFAFHATTIAVPYREMVRKVDGSPPSCFLGFAPSASFTLLGDTFLRSAYAFFDLDNHNVWLAQSRQCGSTPAPVNDASVLATVSGVCKAKGTSTSAVATSNRNATSATASIMSMSMDGAASAAPSSSAAAPTSPTRPPETSSSGGVNSSSTTSGGVGMEKSLSVLPGIVAVMMVLV